MSISGKPVVEMLLINYDEGDGLSNWSTASNINQMIAERLVQFEYSDHCRKIDKATLILRNDDYAAFETPLFIKGQQYVVTWGWPGKTTAPQRVIIKSVKAAGDTITIVAHCMISLMNKEKRSRFSESSTDSEFVEKIAEFYGYLGSAQHIEKTEIRHDITQPRWMTDAQMVRKLANANGFEFYVEPSGFHWHRRDTTQKQVADFIYRVDGGVGTILDRPVFDTDISAGVSRIRVIARDPVTKKMVEGSCGISDETDTSLGDGDEIFDTNEEAGLRGKRSSREEIIRGGLMTQQEAQRKAEAIYRDTAKGRYKCSFSIIGNPDVTAKKLIGLWKVSTSLDGLYFIDECKSIITPGKYISTISCTKDARSETKASNKRPGKSKVNKGEMAEMEFSTDELYEMEILVKPFKRYDGSVVAGFIYSTDGGVTGTPWRMTEQEFEKISPEAKDSLYYQGASSYTDMTGGLGE